MFDILELLFEPANMIPMPELMLRLSTAACRVFVYARKTHTMAMCGIFT